MVVVEGSHDALEDVLAVGGNLETEIVDHWVWEGTHDVGAEGSEDAAEGEEGDQGGEVGQGVEGGHVQEHLGLR